MAAFGKGSGSSAGLRVLAFLVGVFFIGMATSKIEWLTNSSPLLERFQRWAPAAPSQVRWYLETLAIPGAPLFARLVPVGELAVGLSLILGFWSRLAAAVALFMVLNFHFATASFWSWGFLRDGTGPPLIGALLALTINSARLPWTIRS